MKYHGLAAVLCSGLLAISCVCPRYVTTSGRKIIVNAIKAPGARTDIGSITFEQGQHPTISEDIVELDEIQFHICQQLRLISSPTERDRLRKQQIDILLCMQRLALSTKSGTTPNLSDCFQQPIDSWKASIDWCIADRETPVGCRDEYRNTYPNCLKHGRRSCLMRHAVSFAKQGRCEEAFALVGTCQCHNTDVLRAIIGAGREAVCSYLQEK
jgi:hypothetical protein